MKQPNIGDKIWVPTRMSIDHGRDDVAGGIATIDDVTMGVSAGEKVWFVSVKEHPDRSYNYEWLMENQAEWAEDYKGMVACPDPDMSPESNPINGGW